MISMCIATLSKFCAAIQTKSVEMPFADLAFLHQPPYIGSCTHDLSLALSFLLRLGNINFL